MRLCLVPILFRFYLFASTDGNVEKNFINYSWPGSPKNNERTRAAYGNREWRWWGKCSILCIISALLISFAFVYKYGFAAVCVYYYFPVIMYDTVFVLVTFGQHDSEQTFWMNKDSWTHLLGQLSSADRTYGALFDNLFRYSNLHVVHHFIPEVPTYKLPKMTEIFKAKYPHLYIWVPENGWWSIAKNYPAFALRGFVDKVKPRYWSTHVEEQGIDSLLDLDKKGARSPEWKKRHRRAGKGGKMEKARKQLKIYDKSK